MILTVLLLLFPPLVLIKGLRHWLYVLHITLMLVASWVQFPSLRYPLWHPYYMHYLMLTHLISINVITFLGYGWDKRQARFGRWRVPEKTLHALALMGGTPAAFLSSRLFRHKTIKGQFRQMMWAVLIIQTIVLLMGLWLGTASSSIS